MISAPEPAFRSVTPLSPTELWLNPGALNLLPTRPFQCEISTSGYMEGGRPDVPPTCWGLLRERFVPDTRFQREPPGRGAQPELVLQTQPLSGGRGLDHTLPLGISYWLAQAAPTHRAGFGPSPGSPGWFITWAATGDAPPSQPAPAPGRRRAEPRRCRGPRWPSGEAEPVACASCLEPAGACRALWLI